MVGRLTRIVGLGLAVLAIAAPSAFGKTITVTSKQDSGPGTIRQALLDADPGDTIAVPPGTYQVTSAGLLVSKSVTVRGAAARTTILQADGNNRVFDVAAGTNQVTIEGVTITGGNEVPGGGIRSISPLTLTADDISGNRSGGTTGDLASAATGNGGGVYAANETTITRSSIHDNRGLDGGGLYFLGGSGAVRIRNSTFLLNRGDGDGGAIAEGPSLADPAPHTTVTIGNVTAQANFTPSGHPNPGPGHGGFFFAGANNVTRYVNSIIYDNGAGDVDQGPNCWAEPTATAQSLGGNLWGGVDNPSFCNFTTDDTMAEPQASELGNWGGPTDTMRLESYSPPVDLDPADSNCPAIDQRGVPRPQGDGCDAGAVEYSYPTGTVTGARNVTTTTATVEGTANTQGLPGTVVLEDENGGVAGQKSVPAVRGPQPVSLNVNGLAPSHTYRYRFAVTNPDRTGRGPLGSFTTKPGSTPPTVRCHVPKLKGLRLGKAKAKLVKAHCRLGKVRHAHKGRRHRHRVVIRQTLRPGSVRAAGTKVGVTLSRKKP